MNNKNVVTLDEYGNRFEWDEAKAMSNLGKHRIGFPTAIRVFGDPNAVLEQDRVVDGEQRWHAIGMIDDVLMLTVVHVVRSAGVEDITRIISARRAVRKEEHRYEDANGSISN